LGKVEGSGRAGRQSPDVLAKRLKAQAAATEKRRREELALLRGGAPAWNGWRRGPGAGPVDRRYIELADWGGGLAGADLSHCDRRYADLRWTNFQGASFRGSTLRSADLAESNFDQTDFTEAIFDRTLPGGNDLSRAGGLGEVVHLEGTGVPVSLIEYLPALTGAVEPIQYNSSFISDSTADQEFANRLYSRMREAKLRVWYAPENMKGGRKIRDQIDAAIHLHEKLLLVLSDASMRTGWVGTELKNARAIEIAENRRKLFPVRVVQHDSLKTWTLFDADRGVDLAAEVREYFIPDFSEWKNHDKFEKSFANLLRDLRRGDAA
jgi:hypothetical protein